MSVRAAEGTAASLSIGHSVFLVGIGQWLDLAFVAQQQEDLVCAMAAAQWA